MSKEIKPKTLKERIEACEYKCDKCGWTMYPITHEDFEKGTIGAKCDNCLSNLFLTEEQKNE